MRVLENDQSESAIFECRLLRVCWIWCNGGSTISELGRTSGLCAEFQLLQPIQFDT
jgi:hypothetical protein